MHWHRNIFCVSPDVLLQRLSNVQVHTGEDFFFSFSLKCWKKGYFSFETFHSLLSVVCCFCYIFIFWFTRWCFILFIMLYWDGICSFTLCFVYHRIESDQGWRDVAHSSERKICIISESLSYLLNKT